MEAGEETVEKIRKSGVLSGKTICISLDVGNLSSVRLFAAEVQKKVPRIDYLINNGSIWLFYFNERFDWDKRMNNYN